MLVRYDRDAAGERRSANSENNGLVGPGVHAVRQAPETGRAADISAKAGRFSSYITAIKDFA
jgi:hypothetical protein